MTVRKLDSFPADRTCTHTGSTLIGATEYTQDWECQFDGEVTISIWMDETTGEQWEAWECPDCAHDYDTDLVVMETTEPADEDPWNDRRGDR